jgi:hypothetical protein
LAQVDSAPLRLLQNVPGDTDAFLYDDGWIKSNPTFAKIDQPGNVIQLRPGVTYAMAKLSGLLKPALKWLWVDKVWKSNRQLFQGALSPARAVVVVVGKPANESLSVPTTAKRTRRARVFI